MPAYTARTIHYPHWFNQWTVVYQGEDRKAAEQAIASDLYLAEKGGEGELRSDSLDPHIMGQRYVRALWNNMGNVIRQEGWLDFTVARDEAPNACPDCDTTSVTGHSRRCRLQLQER